MLHRWKHFFKHYFPTSLNPIGWFILAAHLYELLERDITPGITRFVFRITDIALIVYSFITLYLLFQLISTASSQHKKRHLFSCLGFLFFYAFMTSYLFSAKSSLDFAVMKDNVLSLFSKEGIQVTLNAFNWQSMEIAGVAGLFFIYFDFKKNIVWKKRQHRPLLPKCMVTACIYLFFIAIPVSSFDEITNLFQSIFRYYHSSIQPQFSYQEGSFPLIKLGKEYPISHAEKPNVFIILVESFNGTLIEKRTPEGPEYTPYFNQLLKKGLYIEHFYGNSIQTCKGHFSTLFSVIPSIRGKEYTDFGRPHFQALPQIMKNNGYTTLFFQAHDNINFDDTNPMMKNNGFIYHVSVKEYLQPEDQSSVWGWGPEDQIFYKRFFNYLDSLQEKNTPHQPYFVALPTVSNHVPFQVPILKRNRYAHPQSFRENYANSIYLSDQALAVFMSELKKRPYLKNSIVIITGDHSFPIGNHGITHNEAGYYEESFKTPFLMIWDGHLKPQRIQEAFSQLDIAPSLIDLLHITVPYHHFRGISLFQKNKKHPIYLIQPYAGQYLSILDYPYRYSAHLKTGNEYYFNLEEDPEENQNLAKRDHQILQFKRLKAELNTIFLNQVLLEKDHIWKPTFSAD